MRRSFRRSRLLRAVRVEAQAWFDAGLIATEPTDSTLIATTGQEICAVSRINPHDTIELGALVAERHRIVVERLRRLASR